MADNNTENEVDTIELDASTPEPEGTPQQCPVGQVWCSIQQKCIPSGGSCTGGSTGGGSTGPSTGCEQPVIKYEDLTGKTEHDRLMYMRTQYEAKLTSCKGTTAADKDARAGFEQALTNINDGLVDIDDGLPTDANDLFTTFYGPTKDKLDPRTRRSTPWGTVICDIEGYKDKIPVATSPSRKTFETKTKDDIKDPNFDGIVYKPSEETKDPEYSKKHDSCLSDIPCMYEELEHPKLKLEDNPKKGNMVDMDLSTDHITTGCANGKGLYDVLMTAIDSSIDLQFKNSRLDAKQFGEFYASAMGSAMQTATNFLVQKEQLKLDAEKINLEREKYDLFLDRHKYEKQLVKLSAEKAVLEMEVLKKKLPLELSLLAQQTKGAEKQLELTARKIETEEATTKNVYKTMEETTKNGVLNRNLTEAKVEQTRVGIRTAKFEAILKKYQAYSTKVQTDEAKATGASNRRLINADVQSKNKQASLYDQQRRTYIFGQRAEVLNIMKDMWNVQIDTLGPEGMAVEAIKGPEISSRLERAALDVGV